MPNQSQLQKNLPVSKADRQKRNLTIRFCLAAIIVTSMLVVALTAAAYLQTREQVLQANLEAVVQTIRTQIPSYETLPEIVAIATRRDWQQSNLRLPHTISFSMFDLSQTLVWKSEKGSSSLTKKETDIFSDFLAGPQLAIIVDPHVPRINSLDAFFGQTKQAIPALVKLLNSQNEVVGVIRWVRHYSYSLEGAERSARRVFWYILAGNLLLFFALFYNFQRGLQTIESQEKTLNKQISRLSSLLSINKNMQKSMKTASSRAVELNEQFLRRVGSDLHDGPAQSLGYAIMRLNKIADQAGTKALSHEFHSVREALDNSIEEIRGISAGLVLPELEHMTLEEALARVVKRHALNSNSEVKEYYKDLPNDIPLPIKITAYRFVQEGLNNAHRHGQASKCRVSAVVKNELLHLSLKDNGMGFRKSQLNTEDGHLGLMGLKDRVESLCGKFNIHSELGVGTAIKVSIPISDEEIPIYGATNS